MESNSNDRQHLSTEMNRPPDFKEIDQFNTIKWLHLSAAIFFLVQTIIYSAVDATANVNPTIGKPTDCDGPICFTTLKHLGEENAIFLIPLFVGLAFLDHAVSFLYCVANEDSAMKWLFQIGSNPFRWMEYSISASVMAVAIAILAGVTDVHLWTLIFVMHAVGMGFGQLIELIPKEEVASSAYSSSSSVSTMSPNVYVKFQTIRSLGWWLGAVSIFTPWLVIAYYFFRAVSSDVPDFVYAAFLGTLVLYITFGVNSYLHNVLGWYSFGTAEIV